MVRYPLTASSVIVLVSGSALAETDASVLKMTMITQSTPHHMNADRTITKRYVSQYGRIVTKSKTVNNGMTGSSVSRTRTVTDPVTGETKSRTMIER